MKDVMAIVDNLVREGISTLKIEPLEDNVPSLHVYRQGYIVYIDENKSIKLEIYGSTKRPGAYLYELVFTEKLKSDKFLKKLEYLIFSNDVKEETFKLASREDRALFESLIRFIECHKDVSRFYRIKDTFGI